MDSTKIIKIRSLFTLILSLSFILLPSPISARSYTIESKKGYTISDKSLETLSQIMSKSGIVWGEIADMDVKQIYNADTLRCSLDNEWVELYAGYRLEEKEYYYTHYQSLNREAHAYVSILGNNIHIDLSTSIGKYNIQSISENEAVLLRYETDIPEEPEHIETTHNSEAYIEETTNEILPQHRTTPTIRVLFMYTSRALDLMGSYQPNVQMRQVVYDYINKANESFSHSNIDAHMQLAYIGQTSYDETSQTWSNVLNHFYHDNDGYMDDVHTLRNKHAADVCVLFLDKNDYCGEAKTINADAGTAFCIVHPIYECNNKFTVVHEIGHLIGCRHNYAQDGNLIPYAYGHGYIHYEAGNPSSSWRTMMSYDNSCNTGCGRIPYWSNPTVYYNGIATGTTTFENNARVWNDRATTVANFRLNPDEVEFTYANNDYSSIFENVEADTHITTSRGYEIQSGQIVDFRSSSYIRILPHTNIKRGAKFRAYISASAPSGNYPQFIPAKNETIENKEETSKLSRKFNISPNPVVDILTIDTDELWSLIEIYNQSGQCILKTTITHIDVSFLPQGLYVIHAISEDGLMKQTKFIKQ